MSPHVATTSNVLSDKLYRKQSVRLNYLPPPQTEAECLYDLKAVCNHIGYRLTSGHYTATCLNSANGRWYLFDDKCVRFVSQEEIITPGAYLLFYQRRMLSHRVPDGINVSVSKCTRTPSEHWSYKMPKPFQTTPARSLCYIKKEDDIEY